MSERARRVGELEREDRLEEAAELAAELGSFEEAARLYERACRFDRAAEALLAAGEPARSLELAARSGDPKHEAAPIEALRAAPSEARLVATRLGGLGRPATAARLLLALGDPAAAAPLFERAGALTDAARARDEAGDPRGAARCLEAALEIDSGNQTARLALGELLHRHAKHAAAVRALQAIGPNAAERAQALPLLAASLAELGMSDAAREIEAEMAALGVGPRVAAPGPVSLAEPDGQTLFGRYRVERDVARTPTARVFKAVDSLDGAAVAVKLFSAATLRDAGRDALARFEREAVVLSQLRHAHIVPLVAWVPEGPAVVLAWMNGGSLADELAKAALSPARAVEIACAILGALAEAHRRGILHRDIKPANVLFDDAGAAYLADFGTAHVADAAATVTSGVIGTLAYMAPEQRAGRPANARSDIYGVGALLVHALTGAPPDARLPYLSTELEAAHRAVVDKLVGAEAERPETALDARDLLRSIGWPARAPAPRSEPPRAAPAPAAQSIRLEALDAVRHRDRVLGREIYLLDAKGSAAERALAFARADHPGLASVLALRRDPDALWVEARSGEPVTGALSEQELGFVRDALAALHRVGGWHGAVDRQHLVRRGGRPLLCFPLEPSGQDPESDWRALGVLGEETIR